MENTDVLWATMILVHAIDIVQTPLLICFARGIVDS